MPPEDILPASGSDPTPAPAPEPRREPRGLTCDFCECVLASDGSVIKRGSRAGTYLDQDLVLRKKDETIARLKDELTQKDERIQALEAKLAETRKRGWFD